jgi:lipopolysaccharide transport system ATP-binding protein
MSDTVIKVEGLGKLYKLGEYGTGSISHDLNRWFARVRGREDPFATIGEVNDRTSKGASDYVWALKDINFKVSQGEMLGIIGRNGAGKSTLLKVLSKVTTPSEGRIKIKGRIASLLEVGTGFHPELTGRENIFLNGAILGMTKTEIKKKFDEIVDFAGVERYIDTPVKRYSSGMYVRLAFAVAAFLEPEILIVDEVLAVGDAEFQKKCIGRMKDVSRNDGRTVLFVSHNMAMVEELCHTGIFLKNGITSEKLPIKTATQKYWGDIAALKENHNLENRKDRDGRGDLRFTGIEFFNSEGAATNIFRQGEKITLKLSYKLAEDFRDLEGVHFSLSIVDSAGTLLINHCSDLVGWVYNMEDLQNANAVSFSLSHFDFKEGDYFINLDCVHSYEFIDRIDYAGELSIVSALPYNYVKPIRAGLLATEGYWKLGQLNEKFN